MAKMRAGEMAYGCSLNFPSAAVIELMGSVGFDYVWLDSEHSPFTPESIEDMCRAAELAGLTPIARAPDVQKALADTTERIHAAGRQVTGDVMTATGAMGLLLEGAREFVSKAKAG